MTLRRVFTDAADDSVLFLDAKGYRFASDQIAWIGALHPYSTFPGATTAAAKCDIDHIREYRAGPSCSGPIASGDPPGQTMVVNAQPLARRHHRVKTHGGWAVSRDPDDPHTFHWTSRYGRRYISNDSDGA
jgi:hypothetical protein